MSEPDASLAGASRAPLRVRGRFRRRLGPPLTGAPARTTISRILALVDVTVVVLVLVNVHGPLRFCLGLTFGLFVPGWAVVGVARIADGALELGLTMAASLSLIMIIAQVLTSVHEWHLGAFEVALALACLPSLLWQSGIRWTFVESGPGG